MPKEIAESTTAGQSRRSFLTKLGLGAAALAAVTTPLAWMGRRKNDATAPMTEVFPGEDSIFHPASDPRLDPRRRQG
ncbi:MAG: twin-arginine translocation signal domain-containing protein [Dehalococcoidia bacterium]|nr:twin-arginine translocation signal domain-containing protein [Dehalococcoidia bacterium]